MTGQQSTASFFDDLWNTISPILGPIAGFFMGGPMGALGGALLSGDQARSQQRNEETAADRQTFRDSVTGAQSNLSTPGGTNSLLRPFQPSFQFQGQHFGVPGSGPLGGPQIIDTPRKGQAAGTTQNVSSFGQEGNGGAPEINLDNIFTQGRDALRAFDEAGITPESVTIGTDWLDQGRAGISSLFDQARSGVRSGIDTDLSSVLSADLAEIGAAGRQHETMSRQNLAANAGQFGGLEGLSSVMNALSSEEGQNRAVAGARARGDTRARELEAQKFVEGLIASLDQSQAGTLASLLPLEGETRAGDVARQTGLATLRSGLVGAASGDKTNAFNALMSGLNTEAGQTAGVAGLQNQTSALLASLFQDYNDILGSSLLPHIFPGRYQTDTGGGGGLLDGLGLGLNFGR